MFRDVEPVDIKTVDEEIYETDRRCGNDETCKYQSDCPEFLKHKEIFNGLQRGSQKYRETLENLKKRICNKSKKGVCCPNPKKNNKCKGGYPCLKEDQCEYAQDLREKFKGGDIEARNELIDLICDRKERTFCCPDEVSVTDRTSTTTDKTLLTTASNK